MENLNISGKSLQTKSINSFDLKKPLVSPKKYSQIEVTFEKEQGILWMHMQPNPRPCFNPTLLNELTDCVKEVKTFNNINYSILASSHPSVFNYGGDLSLFEQSINEGNREILQTYGNTCIETGYINHTNDVTTISLIQGDALGGGFEAALSSEIIIAEKGALFGLPEVLFNMFPGMGAHSYLSRKIGTAKTREMITSGKLYTSEELYELGVVNILAEKGEGELEVYRYISKEERSKNTFNAMRKIAQMYDPIKKSELQDIVDIWVDSAMKLTPRDLKVMKRIIRKQNKK